MKFIGSSAAPNWGHRHSLFTCLLALLLLAGQPQLSSSGISGDLKAAGRRPDYKLSCESFAGHQFRRQVGASLQLRGGCDASVAVLAEQHSKTAEQDEITAAEREAKHLSAAVSMSKMVFSEEEEAGEVGFAGIRIRQAGVWDVLDMQRINLVCLPENYQTQYFWYHILRWPSLAFVAEAPVSNTNTDVSPWRVVGYVLGKMDDDEAQDASATGIKGHVTSLAVMKTHRRKQVAKRLMLATMAQMVKVHQAATCSLHVRSGNVAALRLYKTTLGFEETRREQGYYADKEDAFSMQATLR